MGARDARGAPHQSTLRVTISLSDRSDDTVDDSRQRKDKVCSIDARLSLRSRHHRRVRRDGLLGSDSIPAVPERPTSWQTFLRAHWGAIAGADFFTTEVWTSRGLVTYYSIFVIDLASRRVHVVGSTPHPDEGLMRQVGRTLSAADDDVLGGHRVLICDRDTKWSAPVRERLREAGLRMVQTPFQAPNANAYAERFVRSIKESVSAERSRSVNAISAGRSRRSSRTITASATTKALKKS
jgi:transposase InsO family protein